MNEIQRRIDQYGTAAIKRIERHNPLHTQQLVTRPTQASGEKLE